MKILIYGAGVIGCELAHVLCKAGRHVTVVARGKWKDNLEGNGLVIKHYPQFYTSIDKVNVTDELRPQDIYDLIFVTMQYGQIEEVIPKLAANKSKRIVLVGNNMSAKETEASLKAVCSNKEIAFGFQASSGRREEKRVISIHKGIGMTVGAAEGNISCEFKKELIKAFKKVNYRLTWQSDMDAWLKCHMLFMLPMSYMCYASGGSLKKANCIQRKGVLDAALEGCRMLRKLGIPVDSKENDEYYSSGIKGVSTRLMIMLICKTMIGKLAISNHCVNSVREIAALDGAFEELRQKAGCEMPCWDRLRNEAGMLMSSELCVMSA